MGKISAVLRLTRIEHSLMLVFAVLAAELITKGLPSANYLALSFITPIFISKGHGHERDIPGFFIELHVAYFEAAIRDIEKKNI